jgi:hypothetical protein
MEAKSRLIPGDYAFEIALLIFGAKSPEARGNV